VDLDGDGRREYVVGYTAVTPGGEALWTVDALEPASVDPGAQHVDYTDILCTPDGRVYLAMAGSDRLYLVDAAGHTLFSVPHVHCQGAAIGPFRDDGEFHVALYNSPNGPLVLYDPEGGEVWSRAAERRWPLGAPQGYATPRMHRNRPIVRLGGEQAWIGYADGGWPWGMDGNGEISLEFAPPEHSRKPDFPPGLPAGVRWDDLGYSYAMQAVDIDGDGRDEAVIYDRRFLWVYQLNQEEHPTSNKECPTSIGFC
jgi:hypothetical protein